MPLLILLLFLLSCSTKNFTPPSAKGYNVEIRGIDTRGVKLDFLIVHREDKKNFRRVLILFPGGNGACHFGKRDSSCRKHRNYLDGIWVSNNFLARNVVRFAHRGDLVILVDMPSDVKKRFRGRSSKLVASAYRVSPQHTKDIENLISYMKDAFGVEEVYLIGTSRGTLSVAYLADKLPSVKGVVLTATLSSDPHFIDYCPGETNDFIACTGFDKTHKKVLFVHNLNDGCLSSGYSQTKQVFEKLKTKDKQFISVRGGSEPADNSCSGLTYHGFFGKDEEVVSRILDWVESL